MTESPLRPATVAELIAALQALPDHSLPVEMEGCDCLGPAGARIDTAYPGFVTITRSDVDDTGQLVERP